jgi:hypothetical protein
MISDRSLSVAQWLDQLTSNTGVSDRPVTVAQWLDHLTSKTMISNRSLSVAQWLNHLTSNAGNMHINQRNITLSKWIKNNSYIPFKSN